MNRPMSGLLSGWKRRRRKRMLLCIPGDERQILKHGEQEKKNESGKLTRPGGRRIIRMLPMTNFLPAAKAMGSGSVSHSNGHGQAKTSRKVQNGRRRLPRRRTRHDLRHNKSYWFL